MPGIAKIFTFVLSKKLCIPVLAPGPSSFPIKSPSDNFATVPLLPLAKETLMFSFFGILNNFFKYSNGAMISFGAVTDKFINSDFESAFSIYFGEFKLNERFSYFSTSPSHSITTLNSQVLITTFGRRSVSTTLPFKGAFKVIVFCCTFIILAY